MNNIGIIIVDDHSILREGLRMIIENDPEIEVLGEADNIKDALALIENKKPDVILLDLDLGMENSLDFMSEISNLSENSRILVLTGILDEEIHKQAIQLGANGILLKNQVGGTLLKAIKKINQGEAWVDRTLTARIISSAQNGSHSKNEDDYEKTKISSLTNREREIVNLIAEGLVNKEISERLFIGEKTVRNNLTVIFSKLEVSNRLELAIYATRNGLDK